MDPAIKDTFKEKSKAAKDATKAHMQTKRAGDKDAIVAATIALSAANVELKTARHAAFRAMAAAKKA